jgi:hypothetical protein
MPALVLLAIAPCVVAMASVIGDEWHAADDQALEVLRVSDVGGPHTPWVGSYQRFGFFHPGPLKFWFLAPFYQLFGGTGVLFGVGIINAAASGTAVVWARRTGGLSLAALTALIFVVLQRAMGFSELLDPWNPFVTLLPFAAFVIVAAAAICDDLVALPFAVAVGSFVVQIHLGYAPLVGGLAATAFVANCVRYVVERRRRSRRVSENRVWWAAVTILVAVCFWSAPLTEQVVAPEGNLAKIVRFSGDPGAPVGGWDDALGQMASQLQPFGDWVSGHTPLLITTSSVLPSLIWLGLLAALAELNRRRNHAAAFWLCVTAGAAVGAAVVASSRVIGGPWFYVLRWWWPVAATVFLAIAFAAFSLLGSRARSIMTGVTTAAAVVVACATFVGLPASAPGVDESFAIEALGQQIEPRLDPSRRYLIRSELSAPLFFGIGDVQHGLFLTLEEAGFSVWAERGALNERMFGAWRLASAADVDFVLTVAALVDSPENHALPPGSRVVAAYDALTPSDRERARNLERSIREAVGGSTSRPISLDDASTILDLRARGAAAEELAELAALQRRGGQLLIYVTPSARTIQ